MKATNYHHHHQHNKTAAVAAAALGRGWRISMRRGLGNWNWNWKSCCCCCCCCCDLVEAPQQDLRGQGGALHVQHTPAPSPPCCCCCWCHRCVQDAHQTSPESNSYCCCYCCCCWCCCSYSSCCCYCCCRGLAWSNYSPCGYCHCRRRHLPWTCPGAWGPRSGTRSGSPSAQTRSSCYLHHHRRWRRTSSWRRWMTWRWTLRLQTGAFSLTTTIAGRCWRDGKGRRRKKKMKEPFLPVDPAGGCGCSGWREGASLWPSFWQTRGLPSDPPVQWERETRGYDNLCIPLLFSLYYIHVLHNLRTCTCNFSNPMWQKNM